MQTSHATPTPAIDWNARLIEAIESIEFKGLIMSRKLIMSRELEKITEALTNGADINKVTDYLTPLTRASTNALYSQDLSIMCLLLDNGAKINQIYRDANNNLQTVVTTIVNSEIYGSVSCSWRHNVLGVLQHMGAIDVTKKRYRYFCIMQRPYLTRG
jgi:hypothetical protein